MLLDNNPVEIGTLQPGSSIVVRSGEPVIYREGQDVAVAAPATVTAVRQTVYGQVTDVDKNGEIKLKTPGARSRSGCHPT